MQFIRTGCSRCVLVIGSDVMSRIISPSDEKTYPLFGDGAGAVLLGAGREDQGLLSYSLGSEGDFGELLSIPGGGSREPLTPKVWTRAASTCEWTVERSSSGLCASSATSATTWCGMPN